MLEKRRRDLIDLAAKSLDKAKMLRYNTRTGDLSVTGKNFSDYLQSDKLSKTKFRL